MTPKNFPKIPIPISQGLRFVDSDEILYCVADDHRTILYLFNGKSIRAPRTLSKIQELLQHYPFLRIHRSYLINMEYLEEYNRTDGRFVLMSNGDRLPVSKSDLPFLGG